MQANFNILQRVSARCMRYAPWLLRDCVVTGYGPEHPPMTKTNKCLEFFVTMTVIVTLNGPIFRQYWTILGDIGKYRAISSDIGVIFSSVKSFMCWIRSKWSRTGSVNYKPNMVRPCWIRTVTISLKITDIGRYRCIAIYMAQFWFWGFFLPFGHNKCK